MTSVPFLPDQIYIYLSPDGEAATVPGGDAFWSLPPKAMESFGRGWLISEYTFSTDWNTWEMHPHADEYVYLLSGAVAIYLEEVQGIRVIEVSDRGAVVIPRGIWHTAKVRSPCRMLHVTMGEGTQTRAV